MSPQQPGTPAPRRVLVVEDDPGLLELIHVVLEDGGYEVTGVTDARGALGKAATLSYDVVILDLMLPDSDGIILHGRLRQIVPDLARRTIFMTGFSSQEPVVDYLRSLSAEFIHKPFTPDDLLAAVGRVALAASTA